MGELRPPCFSTAEVGTHRHHGNVALRPSTDGGPHHVEQRLSTVNFEEMTQVLPTSTAAGACEGRHLPERQNLAARNLCFVSRRRGAAFVVREVLCCGCNAKLVGEGDGAVLAVDPGEELGPPSSGNFFRRSLMICCFDARNSLCSVDR